METHPARVAMKLALGAALAAMSFSIANAAATSDDAAIAANPYLKKIIDNCTKSVADCKKQFGLTSRIDRETHVDASFSILSFWKTSDLTFWGQAEALYYTEVPVGEIEYQVGYGYVVYAKQQDAKPSGSGTVSGVSVSAKADVGFTQYSASIIGLAPDARLADSASCESDGLPTDQGLLCAIDFQPSVTQEYFKSSLGRLWTALYKWDQKPTPNSGGKSSICPQIINYRTVDRKSPSKEIDPATVEATIGAISDELNTICVNERPNAHVSYHNGTPSKLNTGGEVDIEGATIKADQTVLSQGYFRNRIYLADTELRRVPYYDKILDHSAEIYVDGLQAAASSPSVLSAIVTLNASVQDERIHTVLRCSGGANAISLKADPVANTSAYTDFVTGIRRAVDSDLNTC